MKQANTKDTAHFPVSRNVKVTETESKWQLFSSHDGEERETGEWCSY